LYNFLPEEMVDLRYVGYA